MSADGDIIRDAVEASPVMRTPSTKRRALVALAAMEAALQDERQRRKQAEEKVARNAEHVSEVVVLERERRVQAEAALQDAREALRGGAGLIAAERKRQVSEEGWTPEHDDEHELGELATAAACYALHDIKDEWWPWYEKWWKPSADRQRDLVKAGALIAAEIDRLERAVLVEGAPEPCEFCGDGPCPNECEAGDARGASGGEGS